MVENAAFAKGVSASEFAREACEIYAHMYLNAYEAAHQEVRRKAANITIADFFNID